MGFRSTDETLKSVEQVWHVVVGDCHDALCGVFRTEELARRWMDYWTARGSQCLKIAGPYDIREDEPALVPV